LENRLKGQIVEKGAYRVGN